MEKFDTISHPPFLRSERFELYASFLSFLNCFRANQMGFKQVFDNLTVKHMDALRKQIQSVADYVLNHCFWTYAMLGNFQNDRKK